MYVIFEGIDTCGKSTQISLLKESFNDIVVTKEPGGTKLGLDIREIILDRDVKSKRAEFFLFLADRAEHIKTTIKPNMDRLIVSDRGFVSGIAYAVSNQPNEDMQILINMNKFALDGVKPDIIFLFVISKEILLSRLKEKTQDNIEKRGIEYLMDVQENMKKVLSKMDIKYICIDASKSIEDIQAKIVKEIKLLER